MADISIINKDNTDYKVKDAAGRLALAEVENKGAKNLFKITAVSEVKQGVRFTINSDGTVTVTRESAGTSNAFLTLGQFIGESGITYTLSGCPATGSDSTYYMYIGSTFRDYGSGVSREGGTERGIVIYVDKTYYPDNLVFKPMICTKAEWDISHEYVPYGKTNAELANENANQQLEIDYAINTGVKNLFDINTSLPLKIYHTTYTLSDGSLTVTSNGSWGHHSVPVNLPAGNYIFTATISNFSKDPSASATSVRMRVTDTTAIGGIEIASKAVTGNGAFELPFTWTGGQCYIQYYLNHTSTTTYVSSFTASNNMIRPAAITDQIYEPYALSNPVLTPAVIKAVDEGAKNIFDIDHLDTGGTYNALYGISNGVLSVTSNGGYGRLSTAFTLPFGTYVMSCNVSNISIAGGTSAIRITLNPSGSSPIVKQEFTRSQSLNLQFTLSEQSTVYIMFYENESSTSYANSADFSNIMICTKAEWDISHTYVPYGKTNAELTSDISALSTENTSQQSEIDYVVNTGAKNLLKNKRTTTTHKGIKFTVNNDGSVTANGTNDGTGASLLDVNEQSSLILDNGDYILTGCPAGGSETGYFMDVTRSPGSSIKDTGSGATFTVGGDYTVTEFRIVISRNITVDNLTFYPMIRPASITDSTFVPYAKTNVDLTNENANQQLEIDYAINTGVKNILNSVCHDIGEPVSSQGRTLTMLPDGGIKIEGTHTGSANYADFYLMGAWSETKYVMNLSNVPHIASIQAPDLTSNSDKAMIYLHIYDRHTGSTVQSVSPTSNISGSTFNFDPTAIYISVYKNLSIPTGGIVVYPMIRRAEITDATFQPYALSNPVLTPAVIKAVDCGAKNLVQLGFTSTSGSSSIPATTNNNDGTITVNGSRVGNATILVQDLITAQTSLVNTRYTLPAGNYVIAPTGNANIGLQVYKHDGTNQVGLGNAKIEAVRFTYSDTDKVQYPYICIRLYCEGNATINNFTFMPMVCTASDWAVSQKFVPYAPTNMELYETCETKVTMQQIYGIPPVLIIPAEGETADLNNYVTPGTYLVPTSTLAPRIINAPFTDKGYKIEVEQYRSGTYYKQTIFPWAEPGAFYTRTRGGGAMWSSWYKFEGTEVT